MKKANHLIDEILDRHRQELSEAFTPYRNHAQRVFQISLWLDPGINDHNLSIAAAFHDLAIWTNKTWDYLIPSTEQAVEYCEINNIQSRREITHMVHFHHKITPYRGDFPSAEVFRKADLVDLSRHYVRFNLSHKALKQLRQDFPFCGFHRHLFSTFRRHMIKYPFRPFPMIKF